MNDHETEPAEPAPKPNTTDYTFPPWWGVYLNMAANDEYEMTREQAEEIRCQWFARQRDKWYLKRQYDSGVHSERPDEIPDDEIPLEDVLNELNSDNDFKIK